MTKEQLKLAFDPGFSTKGNGQGGLGLAISYLMIEAHGGHLDLTQNPTEPGLCACVWLPGLPPRKHDFATLAGRNVIVACPEHETNILISQELDQIGCANIAEVWTQEELFALLKDEPDWNNLILTQQFSHTKNIEENLPASLTIWHLDT